MRNEADQSYIRKPGGLLLLCVAVVTLGLAWSIQAAEKAGKVKVFILAGQSNMEGHGQVRSLNHLGEHPKYGWLLGKLKNADGSWAVRDDVTISYKAEHRETDHGPLTVGWGWEPHEIGPELMFGTIMGEKYDEPVLLIKTAWGGKDVYCDFRSPSAGEPRGDVATFLKHERADGNNRRCGTYYHKMLAEIRDTLANIDDIVPGYEGQGYELAGMAWFQGWNDFCQWHVRIDEKPVGLGIIRSYPKNLAAMFRDLRRDLNAPDMPIVIGELGIGGHQMEIRAQNPDDHEARAMVEFRKAQKAVAEDKSLKNVTFVPTAGFWDERLQELRAISDAYWNEKQEKGIEDDNDLPSAELQAEYERLGGHWYCHYNGSAATYSLIGYALAEALIDPASVRQYRHGSSGSRRSAASVRFDPVERDIEGWKVYVEPALIDGRFREEGEQALKMLANHLARINILVPADELEKLKKHEDFGFWVEHAHPELGAMQYHPSRDWLVSHGYDPRLAKKVHITRAAELLSRHQMLKHPAVVLHELAHAYHDLVLGFDEPRILAAYEKAKRSGSYEKVLLYTGEKVRHYALTDQKEYFAEGTEAYFYRNDFYPFVRAELKEHDPTLYELLKDVWEGPDETEPKAVAQRRGNQTAAGPDYSTRYAELAPTPPMGWCSWNAFNVDIDEEKIKAIADAMVSSGMRDAGYTYLVIDDGWMAPRRDENGALMADPNKFPSGMKAIGDYIHSKGLKFGLYEDRGVMTCQQLPGSFQHEQIDMETFASWGVDYIKIDSCFAENNGRMSSEDYALYRAHIESTGRPIVLSILDFGNAAWVWGGKESAQLWRTSYDIYPWMDSVYACAETSAGDAAIHPAFNGLWQFAGPGHWNDPDMLQVGNIEEDESNQNHVGDRAHFSLWCILAAPLMAGNDLTKMSDQVRDILTAPELIAVNQDKRGIQGYKVYDDGDCEVYNKPLSDGTTAVLLLNKGRDKADITVRWHWIGLSGSQPVRDLWARKDLGVFEDGFTARNLGLHENMMLKVGRPGEPLPGPEPVPLEKYTVTREGTTCLSDLYYSWKADNAPVYNKSFNGGPIRVGGKTFTNGFGCKGRSAFMFKLDGRPRRFHAVVAIDDAYKGEDAGRFRVYNEDFFANKVLWDSGEMTKDSQPKTVDIELNNVRTLMLVFDGDDVLGNWADVFVNR